MYPVNDLVNVISDLVNVKSISLGNCKKINNYVVFSMCREIAVRDSL